MTTPDWLTRDVLEQHSLDMRQFIDFQSSTLPDGQRIITAHNASGLHFTLLPDRGLDIWDARFRGVPLTWLAPGSPFLPDEGKSWLRQFNGGLLTTCGLTHAGVAETDPVTGEFRDLHGHYTRLPARNIAVRGGWEGDDYVLELTGTITQTVLFSEQMEVQRTLRLSLVQPSIRLTDTITNRGDQSTPYMLLYHINLGYPLIQAGVRLDTAHAQVVPRDDAARPGFAQWPVYNVATPQYAEQVYFHHLHADADGWTGVTLANDAFGFEVAWDTRTLPYFTQWKNTRQGIYVSGLEPANCLPEGRSGARRAGRLELLEPGDSRVTAVTMSVLPDADAVQTSRSALARVQETGTPVAGCNLSGYSI